MAEEENPFFEPPDAQVVTVVPVVTQRAIHRGIAVIGAFPHDGDGAGQLEIHVSVVHPACCRIDRLAECLAFDGLKNVRQPVLSFLLSLSIRSWNLSPSFFHIFCPAPLSPNFIASANMSMVGGPPYEHRLAYGSDGGEHGCGCQQRLAHFLWAFPLRGMVGMPTRLQESAGCVSVEQGAPSASTVALPIHISDSDMPLTSGAGAGRMQAGARCLCPPAQSTGYAPSP